MKRRITGSCGRCAPHERAAAAGRSSGACAAEQTVLRAAYRQDTDSHLNQVANAAIGPQLVEFIVQSIAEFRQ